MQPIKKSHFEALGQQEECSPTPGLIGTGDFCVTITISGVPAVVT